MGSEIIELFSRKVLKIAGMEHKHFVELDEVYEDTKFFYLVSKNSRHTPFFDKIQDNKQFSELDAANIFKQLLKITSCCHRNEIYFGDMHPAYFNFDEDDQSFKLVDFGLPIDYDNKRQNFIDLGQFFYQAPEIL